MYDNERVYWATLTRSIALSILSILLMLCERDIFVKLCGFVVLFFAFISWVAHGECLRDV